MHYIRTYTVDIHDNINSRVIALTLCKGYVYDAYIIPDTEVLLNGNWQSLAIVIIKVKACSHPKSPYTMHTDNPYKELYT